MPRRTPGRSIYDEDHLADRIAYERTKREWSLDGLAKRMTEAGCPILPTTINKVERPDAKTGKRRRVPITELLAYAEVFGLTIEEMLQPPELLATREFALLLRAWDQEQTKADAAWAALQEYAAGHDDARDALRTVSRIWAEGRGYPNPDISGDFLLADLTNDEALRDEVWDRIQARRAEERED